MEKILNKILESQNQILKTLQQHSEQFATLRTRIDKLESNIENKVDDKVRGLYDAREVQTDVNQQILQTLVRMEAKIDVLQLETANIRRVK